jgi:hypothetical protein
VVEIDKVILVRIVGLMYVGNYKSTWGKCTQISTRATNTNFFHFYSITATCKMSSPN